MNPSGNKIERDHKGVVAILGSTGLAGQALVTEAKLRGFSVVGMARSKADLEIDLTKEEDILVALERIRPAIIVNSAACTNLDECESNPGAAYLINARYVPLLNEYSSRNGAQCCHISTDHYFMGDREQLHDEHAPVKLVNQYAKTKYAGECFALTSPSTLVIRTNIVGFRRWPQPTFVEWLIQSLSHNRPITMFDDFFTSSIDVRSFAKALFDLLGCKATGLINLGSRESCSKRDFIVKLASTLGFDTSSCSVGSVHANVKTPRADSLGLDVRYAESLLGYPLPDVDAVVRNIANEYQEYAKGI